MVEAKPCYVLLIIMDVVPHISSHTVCSGAKADVGVSDALALSPSHRASGVDGWL